MTLLLIHPLQSVYSPYINLLIVAKKCSTYTKACWFGCKMGPDAVGNPGLFGILHLTYYVLGDKKKLFPSIVKNMVLWVLERKG